MTQIRFAAAALLISLPVSPPVVSQDKTVPSQPRPAPQIAGRLIGTDGVSQLILEYPLGSKKATFIGKIHSTCMVPSKSSPSGATPVALSSIPKGSQMTVFYIRHGRFRRENLIFSLRLDRINGDSSLPQGKMISCFKPAQPPAPK